MRRFLQFAILAIFSAIFQETEAQCVDEKGNPKDWVVIYKLPKNSEDVNPKPKDFIEQGLGYLYITSDSQANTWTKSELSIQDINSIPGRLLSPVYARKNSPDLFRMFYNDEHPNGKTRFDKGHTKGNKHLFY